jgi:hypothetical protein
LLKVPKGYVALEIFFVSARTIKRHHHHLSDCLRFLSICLVSAAASFADEDESSRFEWDGLLLATRPACAVVIPSPSI